MSIFGVYFVSGLLREAGWPQKQGILRKNVVDTTILDGAIGEMVNWAAAIGAGRPERGLQILTEMFRDRDWSSDNAPSIRKFIDGMRSQNSAWAGDTIMSPREIVSPYRFAQNGKTIDAGKLSDEQMRIALEQFCLEGLLWGIANPKSFSIWYIEYAEGKDGNRVRAKDAGVEIDKLGDLSALFDESELILHNYEQDIRKLPEIPNRLIIEARELGREV